MKALLRSGVVAAGLWLPPLSSAQVLEARVEQGALAGTARGRVVAYLGVPYAAPPVGANRWRAPQPGLPWSGIRQADAFGANCQQDRTPGNRLGPWTQEYLISGAVSEDCLYLNVWTPASRASERRPVLFWIYGGAFTSGGGDVAVYDGTNLAARGVVVVNANYRLGLLGFLAHPELSSEGRGSSGNYGLRDQIAALAWVKRNIAAFGGDPSRVTIAGQSAGAASVHDLILSPLAKGLFHQAIPQSGSGMGLRLARRAEAEAAGLRFTSAAGATIAELRARTPEALAEIARQPEVQAALGDGPRFGPIADGAVIPEDPVAALAAGRDNDTPVLTGLTRDEGSAMDPQYRPADAAAYKAALVRRYGSFADRFAAVYPAEQPAVSNPALSRDRGIASMLFWAEGRRRTSRQPIFAYLFTHVEPGPDSARYGAFHSSEIPYVFDTLDRSPGRTFTALDRLVADRLGAYWANFVKTGDPNGAGLPPWPRLDDAGRVMELGGPFTARPLDPGPLELFREYAKSGREVSLF